MTNPMWRPGIAEALGTMALVFVGAGSIVAINQLGLGGAGGGAAGLVGVALAHGLILGTMIIALGHVSGGHFNPAVTLAALFTRRIPLPLAVFYFCAQILGGVAGALLINAAVPQPWWDAPGIHMGTPGLAAELSPAKATLAEAVMTFFLVLVVFGVGMDERNTSRVMAGLAIGLTVGACILFGGPLTGAALNPARAFGPALVTTHFAHQYVYWVGPILGALVAGLVYDAAFVDKRLRVPPPVDQPRGQPPEAPVNVPPDAPMQ